MLIELFAWLGVIMLSGIGLGSILKAWKDEDSLPIRIGYWFGLGLIWNVLLLFIKLTLIPNGSLLGDGFYDLIGIDIVLFSAGMGYSKGFRIKLEKADIKVFATVAALALILLVYFQKYPIFPQFDSLDFHQHFANAISTEKQGVTLNTGISYWGVIYLLAFALRFDSGDIPLVVTRQAMAILVVLSSFIVYLAASKLFGKEKAFWPLVLYAGGGFWWFGFVENSGLWPNFYGAISTLFLVGITLTYFETKGVGGIALFLLSLFDLFFSHYTSFLIIPAILVYGAFRLKAHPKKSVFLCLSIILPALYIIFGPFRLIDILRGFTNVNVNGGALTFPTPLSNALNGIPVMSQLVEEMYSDLGSIVMLVGAAVFIWFIISNKRDPKLLIPLTWMITIFVIAPSNLASWRFAMVALVPLSLMVGFVISKAMEKGRRTWHDLDGFYPKRGVGALAIAAIILTGGAAQTVLALQPDFQPHPHDQQAVYDALKWFSKLDCSPKDPNGVSQHNPNNVTTPCTFITPTDWELTYSNEMFDRGSVFSCSYVINPETASGAAASGGFQYMIMTGWETCSPFPCPAYFRIGVMNSTAGHSLQINVTAIYQGLPDGTRIQIGVNGTLAGSPVWNNRTAYAILRFHKGGFYQIQAALGDKKSWYQNIYMGLNVPTTSTPFSFTTCQPINWTSQDLFGATLVYDNPAIRIWKVTK